MIDKYKIPDHRKLYQKLCRRYVRLINKVQGFFVPDSAPRILLYTDSRGNHIPGHTNYPHYGDRLSRKYQVDAYLCPQKWTTILDFLKLYQSLKSTSCYDAIILHVGVVDASPRPQKIMVNTIYPDKKSIFDEVFGEQKILSYINSDLQCDYEGDKTINMYSIQMAKESIITRLLEIPNLIWIGANMIDTSWRGNYWKDRPANIQLIEEYSRIFTDILPMTINLLDLWSLEDVRIYTFDNIHPNKKGSDFIYRKLEELLHTIPTLSRVKS